MKNKIIQLLLLICCLPALTGCIREEEYANDPVGNFEQLWKIIDEQYCFLEAKGIDWDAVHEKYRKLVVPTMSNDDLFDLLSQMLYTLKDGHVNLSSAKRTSFYDEWYQGYDWNYREDILYQTYLGSASSGYYTAAGLKYKIFDNNIGYIKFTSARNSLLKCTRSSTVCTHVASLALSRLKTTLIWATCLAETTISAMESGITIIS